MPENILKQSKIVQNKREMYILYIYKLNTPQTTINVLLIIIINRENR